MKKILVFFLLCILLPSCKKPHLLNISLTNLSQKVPSIVVELGIGNEKLTDSIIYTNISSSYKRHNVLLYHYGDEIPVRVEILSRGIELDTIIAVSDVKSIFISYLNEDQKIFSTDVYFEEKRYVVYDTIKGVEEQVKLVTFGHIPAIE
jgi:hypothetical protein